MKTRDWKSLLEAEQYLAERFAELRDGRTGPVFFVEHGLSEPDAEDLREAVGRAAKHHPLQTNWWRGNPLPLIVTATEVGYQYRGTGTDFWPKLESALGTRVSLEARQRVRDLFARCSLEYRGAKPPVTPWTRAFHLIAWPVTHALAPLEFHRQLSAALANLQSNVQDLDDDHLHRAVRLAARRPSTRFEAFLEDGSHAVPVIRALLGGGNGEISHDTVARIDLDLTADRDARIDLAIARRRQKRLRKRPGTSASATPRKVLFGLLQLRLREGGRLTVEARFPAIGGPDAERLRRTLRRRRFRPRLWDVASPVPSEWLLSGLPFPLHLRTVPDAAAPLLQGLDDLGIDGDLVAILDSFRLDFTLPLVFVPNADGDLARCVRGTYVSAFRECWLLAEAGNTSTFSDLPILGDILPLACHRLDPSEPRARMELDRLGYRVRDGLSVSVAGAPPLDDGAAVPRYLVGDERIVVSRQEHPGGAQVELGSESVSLDGNLVRIRVPKGKHLLEISTEGASRREPFEGVRVADDMLRQACWIELSADERTVQALLGGSIALRVDGLAPLEGLTLTVEVEIGDYRTGTSLPLDPLPQILVAGQEPWPTLLNEATRERVVRDHRPVVLHARVGALAKESWTLERSLRPSWWTRGPDGLSLDSELGPIKHGEISIFRPAEKPVTALSDVKIDTVLLAPLEPDEETFGPGAGFTTFCRAPSSTALLAPPIVKPRLRRSRWGSTGSAGLQDLTEAWLRWSLAECDTFTAEIRRRQAATLVDRWIAELTCGEIWALREEEIRSATADPWKLLVEECLETGRGLDELIELSERDQGEVIRLAVAEIRRIHPDLWARLGPLAVQHADSRGSLLDDADYADFDAACARAYEQLADRYRKSGEDQIADLLEAADPGAAPDQWDPVLESAIARSELRELGALLLPTDTARWLMSLDLTLMSLDEIVEEVHLWAMDSRNALAGEVPSSNMLRAILALWIAPDAAVSLDWRGALERLVAERPLARAARYLALRARSVRLGSA